MCFYVLVFFCDSHYCSSLLDIPKALFLLFGSKSYCLLGLNPPNIGFVFFKKGESFSFVLVLFGSILVDPPLFLALAL